MQPSPAQPALYYGNFILILGIICRQHIPYLKYKCFPFGVLISCFPVKLYLSECWTTQVWSLLAFWSLALHFCKCLDCNPSHFHHGLCDCLVHYCLIFYLSFCLTYYLPFLQDFVSECFLVCLC